jgi:hypothetical protein
MYMLPADHVTNHICNDKCTCGTGRPGNVSLTGRYQICNDKYYVHVVPADQVMLA